MAFLPSQLEDLSHSYLPQRGPVYGKVAVNGANPHPGALIMTVNGPELNDQPVRAIVWSDYI